MIAIFMIVYPYLIILGGLCFLVIFAIDRLKNERENLVVHLVRAIGLISIGLAVINFG